LGFGGVRLGQDHQQKKNPAIAGQSWGSLETLVAVFVLDGDLHVARRSCLVPAANRLPALGGVLAAGDYHFAGEVHR
jgi:hypothetical protein